MKPCGLCATTRVQLVSHLRKDAKLSIRITTGQKVEMADAAKAMRLTLTEYLIRLHEFAKERA